MKKIIIGSDHAGFSLKERLKSYLKDKGYSVNDIGAYSKDPCDYPDIAYNLAKEVSGRRFKRGILICRTGIGNSIVANRVPGVFAALCYNTRAAHLCRQHNNSNVLVLGSAFVNPGLATRILNVWLNTEFQGGRHRRRLNKIKKIENVGRLIFT